MPPPLSDAVALWEEGNLPQAADVCRAVLESDSDNGGAWHLLGLVSFRQRDFAGAISAFAKAAELHGENPALLCDLGAAHALSGDHELAAERFSRALQLDPRMARAWNNLGNALRASGRIADARRAYLEALRLTREAEGRDPVAIDAHFNLANLLRDEGFYAQAIEHYERALQLNPRRYDVLTNLGSTLQLNREDERAIGAYRRALAIEPSAPETLANLGALLAEQDQAEEGVRLVEQAARLRPDRALWEMRTAAMCPTVFRSDAEVEHFRTDLESKLDRFMAIELNYPDEDALAKDAFTLSFNLAHQGHDNRRLMQKFAAIYAPHIRPRILSLSSGMPRVGFVVTAPHEGGFLRTMAGVVDQLDAQKFKAVVFFPAPTLLACQQVVRRDSVEWVPLPSRFSQAADEIVRAGCHAIYFHKVGADPLGYLLPFARLAPVQFTSWSTHMTSGVPQIDYYLSSQSIETAESDQHYCERLIRFSSFPIHEQRHAPFVPAVREEFGLPSTGSLYVRPQRLAKFHPGDDALLRAILEADPEGHLVIVGDSTRKPVVETLVQRLRQTLGAVSKRLVVVPPRNHRDFCRMLSVCDVFLDSRKFGSGLMAYDAMSVDLPIVAFRGRLKVERYAHAFYDQMGIAGPLAESDSEYVDAALRLAKPGDDRERARREIRDSKHVLFDDRRVAKEFERFLEEAIATATR